MAELTARSSADREAKTALEAHFNAFDRIASEFPALVSVTMAIGHQLLNYAKHKAVKLKDVTFDNPRWSNDGHIVVRVRLKGKPLHPNDVHL